MATDSNVRVTGTGPGDSISLSGRSDDPIQVIFRGGGSDSSHYVGGAKDHPFVTVVNGGDRPLSATVNAHVAANFDGGVSLRLDKVDVDVGVKDSTVTFRLFGILPLLSIRKTSP